MSDPLKIARDRVQQFGLPPHLLPETVTSETFDPTSGRFTVQLSERTLIEVAGVRVRYKKNLSGVLRQGAIEKLKGVEAKKGLWLSISTILAEEDQVRFMVGRFSQTIPAASLG